MEEEGKTLLSMPVELQYRYFGGEGKPPLVILHGLLGSSRNWQVAGRDLAADYEVFALDLRNHGSSPHADSMTFDDMVEDLSGWLKHQKLGSVTLMGHSLGGRVAMLFATRHPLMVRSLVVVDVAPKDYPPLHRDVVAALRAVDLGRFEKRTEAEKAIAGKVENWTMRKFLLTNLVREPDGGLKWQVPLDVLEEYMPLISGNPLSREADYSGPCLFVRGALSNYILDGDKELIGSHFPKYILSTIRDAGHFVHTENREAFVTCIRYFQEESLGKKKV